MNQQIDKYKIVKQIYSSSNSILYLAKDVNTDETAVLKSINTSLYHDEYKMAELKNEYELLRKINSDYVVKALDYIEYQNSFFCVMEYCEGVSLSKYMNAQIIPLDEFLTIAISIVNGLGDMHRQGVIHRDINPSNIIYHAETKALKIIDLGIASGFSYGNPQEIHSDAATLKYISPEQTKRMNRRVDFRTDFYSMGMMFYEMLCGHHPFASENPSELVYAQLAKVPQEVSVIHPEIPKMISKIVAKLMEKMPEDRYASADGIRYDLNRCMKSLKKGDIPEFTLGTCDYTEKFEISRKIYGREEEVAQLRTSYDLFLGSGKYFVTIGGYAGTGKTSLVNQLQKIITKNSGIFIGGKFDQYQRNVPYYAFFKAIEKFCDYVFSETESSLLAWKEKLNDALGQDGKLLTDKIPKLEHLLGEQQELPKLTLIEEQSRFKNTLQRFLQAAASMEYPLILFIDDIHIADRGSLEVLEEIMINDAIMGLFIVACYRNNEVDDSHQLMISLKKIKSRGGNMKHIELMGLEVEDITQLISDSMHCTSQSSKELAFAAYKKTNGNPFYLIQFLKHCYTEKLIQFSQEECCFVWDVKEIEKLPYYDNVVDFLIQDMAVFPPEANELLSLAACIGQSFHVDALAYLSSLMPETIIEMLQPMVDSEIIRPSGQNSESTQDAAFDFCHDRFQQAYYTIMPEEKRDRIHLNVAGYYEQITLVEEVPLEQQIAIAEHYSKAISLIQSKLERRRVAEVLLEAARLSGRLSAFDSELHFIEKITGELPDLFLADHRFQFDVYYEYHLTFMHLAKYKELDETYEILTGLTDNLLDLTESCCNQAVSYSNRGEYEAVGAIAFDMLAKLGVTCPEGNLENTLPEDMEQVYKALQTFGRDGREMIKEMEDPVQIAICKISNRTAAPLFFSNPNVCYWLILNGSKLVLEHGISPDGLQLFAFLGMPLIRFKKDYKLAYKIVKYCMEKAEEHHYHYQLCRIYHLLSLLYLHWADDHRKCIPYARETFRGNNESGDFEFACFSYFTTQAAILETSGSLDDLKLECEAAISFAGKLGNNHAYETFVNFQQFYRAMKGETHEWGSFNDVEFDEELFVERNLAGNNMMALCYHYTLRALSAVIYSDYEKAFEMTEKAAPLMTFVSCFYVEVQHNFLHSLAICKKLRAADAAKEEEQRLLETLRQNQKWLGERAQDAPMNFLHLYTAIKAEIRAMEHKSSDAIALYNRAIKAAEKNDRLLYRALFTETVIENLVDMKGYNAATQQLQNAHHAYASWGASGKIEQMSGVYRELFSLSRMDNKLRTSLDENQSEAITPSRQIREEELASSQSFSEKIHLTLEKQINVLVETSGAQDVYFLTKENEEYEVQAQGHAEGEKVRTVFAAARAKEMLPMRMIHYVERTGETVILEAAEEYHPFIQDDYFLANQCKSILCMPVVHKNNCRGILYLENNAVEGAFREEQAELLNIAALQLALSLENAGIYEESSHLAARNSNAYNLNQALFNTWTEAKEAEERNKLMLDASPLASSIWDDSLNMIDCNEAAVKLFGLSSKAEYCERSMQLNAPQTGGKSVNEMLGEYLKMAITEGEVVYQWMYQKPDGELIPAEVTLKKVAYKNTFRIMRYSRDLRAEYVAKEEVREADERNRVMVEATPTGFVFWDDQARIIDCNDAVMAMFGIEDKDVLIKNFLAFSPKYQKNGKTSQVMLKHFMNLAMKRGRCVYEWMHQDFLGQKIPTEVVLVRVNYRGTYRIAGFTRDLREYKAMLEVIRKNEDELRTAKKIAESSAKAKSEFLANMSHEIRTPMNAIIGMTNIGLASDNEAKMRYCFDKVNEASRHLLALINDILDMSKIEANKLELHMEAFDLEKMLASICNINAIKVEEKSLKLMVNMDPKITHYCIGDELRLSQVVTNLLSNAIKFTPENGNIQINVRMQELSEAENNYEIEVIDTGIGMSKEQLPKVFQSFQQADSNITRRFGGTGLGLAISKNIVNLMGGEIGVRSEEGKGSCFYFNVKMANDEKMSESMQYDFSIYQDLRVLVVDNDKLVREYMKNMMTGSGIACDTAENKKAAVDLAERAVWDMMPYDIVFADYGMNGLDGIRSIAAIRETSPNTVGAIMVSILEWNKIETQANEAGITVSIPKPIFRAAVIKAINDEVIHLYLPEETQGDAKKEMQTYGSCRMLLVEDNDINREIVVALLEDTKIIIDCAVNGEEAVGMYLQGSEKYDVILMDVQMPVMDGLTATRHIRQAESEDESQPAVPIIALTANVFKEDIDACKKAGMVDHISKPVEIDELMEKVAKYLEGKGDEVNHEL